MGRGYRDITAITTGKEGRPPAKMSDVSALVPLPPQPGGVPWPTTEWPEGPVPNGVDLEPLMARMFDETGELRTTYAVVVVQGGRIIAERYANEIEHWDKPNEPVDRTTKLLSWSMAKSMLHAIVGMLVAEGRLDLDAPAPVPRWHEEQGDPRQAITLRHLLEMRDGLDFVEDYVDDQVSDVIHMLFGDGKDDVVAFAEDRPLATTPGERFSYSSGTSNIVSGIVARLLGAGQPYEDFLRQRLFDPIGMSSATPTFDPAGTWIASSFVYAAARDFARFGLLYLRDGVWDGARLLPEGWVDWARTPRSVDDDGSPYGAHWWVIDDDHGTFRASGYEGQSILLCPSLDLIMVRLGKTPEERNDHLKQWRLDLVAAFAAAAANLGGPTTR
jgi:CubicO group peptidase (beta-lactamase class C family)